MRVEWIKNEKVQWLGDVGLGLVTGDRAQAKILLVAWGKANPTVAPVKDYGTPDDITGYWKLRDQLMMDAFVDWWTAKGGQPPAFKQLPDDTPAKGEVTALQTWFANPALQQPPNIPGFPPFDIPGFPPIDIPGLVLTTVPTGWPTGMTYPPEKPAWWPQILQYPPIGDQWSTSAPAWWTAASASLPNWPPPKPNGWPSNFPWPVPPDSVKYALPCTQLCEARFGEGGTTPFAKGLTQCKADCVNQPSQLVPGGDARPAPGGGTTTTTDTSTSSGPSTGVLVFGGLALLGLGALLFMRPAAGAQLQENLYVGVGAAAGLGRRRRRKKKRRSSKKRR